jgi:hypothetical protein
VAALRRESAAVKHLKQACKQLQEAASIPVEVGGAYCPTRNLCQGSKATNHNHGARLHATCCFNWDARVAPMAWRLSSWCMQPQHVTHALHWRNPPLVALHHSTSPAAVAGAVRARFTQSRRAHGYCAARGT